MKKDINYRKQIPAIICSFFIPAALLSIVFAFNDIFPFGGKSILIYDLRSQYVDFYAAFSDIISGEGSFYYSFSRAFGGDFFSILAYYLMSPFNLILLFFNEGTLIEGITLIYYLKIMFASLLCFFCLSKSRLINIPSAFAVILSVVYSFCGFAVMYAQNIPWLDMMIILPLVVIAAEKLSYARSPIPFALIIAVAFLVNFYLAVPILLFSAVLLGFFVVNQKERKESILRLIASYTAAAGTGILLSCPIVYTVYCKLITTKLSDNNILLKLADKEELPGLLFKLFLILLVVVIAAVLILIFCKNRREKYYGINKYASIVIFLLSLIVLIVSVCIKPTNNIAALKYLFPFIFDRTAPQLYISVGVLVLIVILTVGSFIRKEYADLNYSSLVLIAMLPVFCLPLDIILHSGQPPISFPARYSFIISFVMVFAAARALSADHNNIHRNMYSCITGTVLAGYIVSEICINACMAFSYNNNVYYGYLPKSSYDNIVAEVESALEQTDQDNKHRTEKTFYRYLNDSLTFNYLGLSHYSSMYSKSVIRMSNYLGYGASAYWSCYFGSTPVLDALFDVRYVLDITDAQFASDNKLKPCESKYCTAEYEKIGSTEYIDVYENNNYMGLAYLTSANFDLLEWVGNPFENQNRLLSALMGEKTDVFVHSEQLIPSTYQCTEANGVYKKASSGGYINYSLKAPITGGVYMYLDTTNWAYSDIKVNGEQIAVYQAAEQGMDYSIWLGDFEAGENIDISIYPRGETFTLNNIYVSHLVDDYEQIIEKLPKGEVKYDINGSRITLETASDSDTVLFMTIPSEDGWEIKIDGERTDYYECAEALMYIPVDAGTHMIEMKYRPSGSRLGYVLGGFGVVMFAALYTVDRFFAAPCRKKEQNTAKVPEN